MGKVGIANPVDKDLDSVTAAAEVVGAGNGFEGRAMVGLEAAASAAFVACAAAGTDSLCGSGACETWTGGGLGASTGAGGGRAGFGLAASRNLAIAAASISCFSHFENDLE